MAEALDGMEKSVSSWEADFIESVLVRLRKEHRPLTDAQAEKLKEVYDKYLGEEAEGKPDEDDVDEDDFV
jgi:hypothetical protein